MCQAVGLRVGQAVANLGPSSVCLLEELLQKYDSFTCYCDTNVYVVLDRISIELKSETGRVWAFIDGDFSTSGSPP